MTALIVFDVVLIIFWIVIWIAELTDQRSLNKYNYVGLEVGVKKIETPDDDDVYVLCYRRLFFWHRYYENGHIYIGSYIKVSDKASEIMKAHDKAIEMSRKQKKNKVIVLKKCPDRIPRKDFEK